MRKMRAVGIAFRPPMVVLAITMMLLSGIPVQAAPPAQPLQDPGDCVVTSTNDSGPGSLRSCMAQLGPGDTITFSTSVFPPANPATITVLSALPIITMDNVTIDGSNAGVILDGLSIGGTPEPALLDDISLRLDGGPNLIYNGDFSIGLGHWRPRDNRPGATRSINTSDFRSSPNAYEWNITAPVGRSHTVYDTTNTSDPLGDGAFSGDSTVWIPATGGSTAQLRFWYKYGGLSVFPRVSVLDGDGDEFGVWEFNWEADWTEAIITQTLPDDAVAIAIEFNREHSQSQVSGLVIDGAQNVVVKGLQILNFPNGIKLRNGASHNTIGGTNGSPGGTCSGDCNLISGGAKHGVQISGGGTTYNVVSGNYIGTDISGTSIVRNLSEGIVISGGAGYNLIGGDTPGERNLISGSGNEGVDIEDSGTMSNTVSGNYIGTDVTGTKVLTNGLFGVHIEDAAYNLIGGDTPEERNLISGNDDDGVRIEGSDAMYNTVSGNYIGTDALGTAELGNKDYGVRLEEGASLNTIGGDTPGQGNLISGNGESGVAVDGSNTLYNTIRQNSIYDNNLEGIELTNGGNTELSHPWLMECSTNTVRINAPVGIRIEVFSDDGDQGRYFHSSFLMPATEHTYTQTGAFTGAHVTATATDGAGNTSEFSEPCTTAIYDIYLPIIFKSH
jgi:hypothetical protein